MATKTETRVPATCLTCGCIFIWDWAWTDEEPECTQCGSIDIDLEVR